MSDPILIRNHAVLAKIEATSGTDAMPTGAANAIKVSNLKISPLKTQKVDRSTSQPYLGNSKSIMVAGWTTLEYEVEIAGAGEPGDLPQYDPLLQGCGFGVEVVADTEVIYRPISTGFKSLTQYVEIDGVLYKTTFVAGSVSLVMNALEVPKFRFSFTGLFRPIADGNLPGVVYRDVIPVAVNKANTPTFELHNYAALVKQLTLDMKVAVSYRNFPGHESVRITGRTPGGSLQIENTRIADHNWWTSVSNATDGPLHLVHGTLPGNIVDISAPAVQLEDPDLSEDQGIQMLSANFRANPALGNDELVIRVK